MSKIIEYSWKNLFNNMKIEINNLNKIIDEEKISNIVNTNYAYFLKHKKFNFNNLIKLIYIDNRYYLIDGQDLFYVMKGLYNITNLNYSCKVEIINSFHVKDKEEKKNLFNCDNLHSEIVYW